MIIGRHKFYCGMDPGHKGAIALLNAAGTSARLWKMPSSGGELNVPELRLVFKHLALLPDVVIGLEWPQPWPGAFNNVIRDADNFGRQKATLETLCNMYDIKLYRIPPSSWMGKLGLEGKNHVGAVDRYVSLWDASYPHWTGLIRGKRGGVLSGPLDAFLIAHYLRLIGGSAAASAVRGSIEHFAAVMGSGPGKRRRARMPNKDEI